MLSTNQTFHVHMGGRMVLNQVAQGIMGKYLGKWKTNMRQPETILKEKFEIRVSEIQQVKRKIRDWP